LKTRSGSVYPEIEIERFDLETIISDFVTGQFMIRFAS